MVDNAVSACQYIVRSDIRDQVLKLSSIAPNFKRFCFPKFYECDPPKLYQNSHVYLAARYVEKFRKVTPPGPKVITANTVNFKPLFACSLLWDTVLSWVRTSKPCSLSNACKNLRRQDKTSTPGYRNMIIRKTRCPTLLFVGQS